MRINLGSGIDKRKGWISVDFNSEYQPDIIHDLRELPLPFGDCDAEYIYLEMTLSQLTPEAGQALLRDCRRILQPAGTIRIHEYDFEEWLKRWTLRTEQFAKMTPAERHYYWSRRYGWQLIYDRKTLERYLHLAGFVFVTEARRGFSDKPELCGLEKRRSGFIMEGDKGRE